MATRKETIEHILDQLAPLPVRARAMFGEYGLYCGEKFVAVICDDTLFVKPTPGSEVFIDLEDDDFPDHIDGPEVDLSALLIETLALAIDPYPRRPGESLDSLGIDVAGAPAGRCRRARARGSPGARGCRCRPRR